MEEDKLRPDQEVVVYTLYLLILIFFNVFRAVGNIFLNFITEKYFVLTEMIFNISRTDLFSGVTNNTRLKTTAPTKRTD